ALSLRPLTALGQEQEPTSSGSEARSGRGLGQEALAVTMGRNFPYEVLVNVAIADLQVLRDTARKATRMSLLKSEYREEVRNEAIFFALRTRRRELRLSHIVNATASLTAASMTESAMEVTRTNFTFRVDTVPRHTDHARRGRR